MLQKTYNESYFLEFNKFKLQKGYDAIYVYGGNDESAPLLKTFSADDNLVSKIQTNHKYLFVTFKTDDRKKPPGNAFMIKY